MNAAISHQPERPSYPAVAGLLMVLVTSLILSGCAGRTTPSERQARAQVQAVAGTYRPHGEKPPLPELTTNSTLADLVRFAMLNQPRVEAAYYDWLASVERITVARSLPDPQITFQMDIQDIVSSIMPGLMMNFPAPGKLRAGAEVASAESQANYFAFETSVIETTFEVKSAFYKLYFLEERTRVNRQTLQLLDELERLARAQNQVGKVTLQDVLRAQIEQDRVKTEIANLEDSRGSILSQMKAALGLKAEQPLPPMPRTFESTPLDVTSDKLLQDALKQNTRLKALEADVRAAEAAIALAHKGKRPDSSLGLMADVKMNPVLYRPLGTISLPLWRDKIAAQIAEAENNKRAAEARLSREQIDLAVSLAERSYLFREASRNLVLLREQLLPKARQSLEVARIGYLSGQLDFFNLSDTERTLLGFEVDEVQARTQRELALVELALLVEGLPAGSAAMSPGGAGMGGSSQSTVSKSKPAGMTGMK